MDDASRQRAEPLNDVSLPPAAREAETLRASLVRIARLAFFAVFVVVTTLSVLYFQPDKAVPKDWPREAIPPGGEARIRVQFDSRDLTGPFTKDIAVLANTIPSTTALALTGTVVGPEPATPSTP